jgi:hypothetical protein
VLPHPATAAGACRRSRCMKTAPALIRASAVGYRELRAV